MKKYAAIALGVGMLASGANAQTVQPYTASVFAGNGTQPAQTSDLGDGGAATSGELYTPYGIVVASSGVVYISDPGLNVIRAVSTSGTISEFAGTLSFTGGYTGDGAAATASEMNAPEGLALDSAGNLYIADTGNNVIRKIDSSGNISTFAGNSSATVPGDLGAATSAELNSPSGVAVDSAGNVYIADTGDNVVRKVNTSGIISLVAGNYTQGYSGDGGKPTAAQLYGPTSIAFDSTGNMYISDSQNDVIRMVTPAGIISTFAGKQFATSLGDGGPATSAALAYPHGVTTDEFGNVYICDYQDGRIRVVNSAGVVNSLSVTETGFSPTTLAIATNGTIYVTSFQSAYVYQLTPVAQKPVISSGGVVSASGFGDFGSVTPGTFIEIYGSFLAKDRRSWTSADFTGNQAPTLLDGTSVTVGGLPAFVYFINDTQVDALTPSGLATGSQPVVVKTAGGSSAAATVNVNATEPGLLAPSSFLINGTQYVTATLTDGVTYILPTGAIAGVTSRPAQAGDTIVLYGIGFGPVTPDTTAGQIAQGLTTLNTPVTFYFGDIPATPTYAGLAPGFVGLYQFNVVVPSGIAASNAVPLTIVPGTGITSQSLAIAIQ